MDNVKNFVEVEFDTGFDDTDTSVSLVSGDGAKLLGTSEQYNLVVYNSTDYNAPHQDPDVEIIRVTARTDDALTIQRPASGNDYNGEGSSNTAKNHNTGGKTYKAIMSITKNTYDDLKSAIENMHTGRAVVVASNTAPTAIKASADYVCDGTDDDVQIQSAIDDFASSTAGKGTVFLTEGTFNISTTINIDIDVSIIGSGWGTILHAEDALDDYVIDFTPPSSTVGIWAYLAHFKIECNGANQTTAGGGIYAQGAIQSVFDHLWINEPFNDGIYFHHISSGFLGHHNRMISCLFDEGDNSSGSGRAIRFEASDENMIIACDFESNGGSGSNAYHIYDQSGGNTIDSCVFVGGKDAIYIDLDRDTINNCTFDGVNGEAVILNGTKHRITSNLVFLTGEGTTANTTSSIYLLSTSGENVIVGNVFESHSTAGLTRSLLRDGGTGENMIVGNQFVINGSVGTSIVEDNAFNNNTWLANKGVADEFQEGVTVNDQLIAPSGSASAPTFSHEGDLDTGIYFPSNDQVAVAVAGTGKYFFDNNGRFGVNTGGTQDAELHIVGGMMVEDNTTPTKGFRTRFGGATDFEFAGAHAYFSVWANGDFSGSQKYKMIMENNNDIVQAIGTWQFRDGANGDTHNLIDSRPAQTGDLVVFNEQGESRNFRVESVDNTHMLYVDGANNRVGINQSSPDYTFDVGGAIALRELSADPSDPDEGCAVMWMSDGTGAGDDGDVMIKVTAGGSTKTITLVDFSAF